MEEKELAPHIDDIEQALEGELDRDDIEDELDVYLNRYGVGLKSAKSSIVKKYGGTTDSMDVSTEKKIENIQGDEQGLSLKGRIVYIDDKEIEQEGEKKEIKYGILGDDTGTIPFTLWEQTYRDLDKGDAVGLENVYATLYDGDPQINIGSKSDMKTLDEEDIPEFDQGSSECKIEGLEEDMNYVGLTGKIVDIERKMVQTDDGDKELFSGVIADETGRCQFSAWNDYGLDEEDIIEVNGAYVTTWRGIPQVNMSGNASVEILEGSDLEGITDEDSLTIEEVERRGGAIDASVEGVIVDIKDNSGLVFRCPECGRVIQKDNCRVHGQVEGNEDLRIKAVLDDETGTLTLIANRELTEDLLGYDLEKALEIAKDEMTKDAIRDDLIDVLLAKHVKAKGNVTSDEYGLMQVATDLSFLEKDIDKEAKSLLEEEVEG